MRIVLPAVAIPAVVLILYLLIPGVSTAPWTVARVVGAILAILGYLLVCFARIQLGGSFSVRPKARALVTHGLYSRIRNPMYVFVDVMLIGIFLLLNLPWLLFLVLIMAIMQTVQARREARVLEQAFGREYIEYRNRTWF